jgi:N-acetylmuramate 1-kinase
MHPTWVCTGVDHAYLTRIAELVALKVRAGDLITLSGDLGAGKTTFARALIRALLDDLAAEVPSPTFTIVQSYATPRIEVAHFDLYRLNSPDELDEVGFDDAVATGIALVEWPERAGDRLHGASLDIALAAGPSPETRTVTLAPGDGWTARLQRLREMVDFLNIVPDPTVTLRYLQGDASPRAYARLADQHRSQVIMDSPRMADGPPIRDGLPYSRIAHLAEDVMAFHAVREALASRGLNVPAIRKFDHERGFLVLDDYGNTTFARALEEGYDQRTMWSRALDGLIALRAFPPPEHLAVPGGGPDHILHRYDRRALTIEIELLTDWYWPAEKGAPIPADIKAEFLRLWDAEIDRLEALPLGWVLRDYHSPNLMWFDNGRGGGNVGVLDFQDAMRGPWAYDVVSLLQDARLDVPETIENNLLAYYRREVTKREPDFDSATFDYAYAALGAQRNTKLLGIFTRLAKRDLKPAYLAHIPRIWRYLQRDLRHPALVNLQAWFDTHFPHGGRQTNS